MRLTGRMRRKVLAVQESHGTVATDWAEIYYETRGDGPPVLIMQGGPHDAGATEQLVEALAECYHVISYDRRGLSRSTVSAEAPSLAMWDHAADAASLLDAVSTGPARIVGSSIGALIGLHLAVRQPERVAMLVAHEPPMASVVLDREREAAMDRVATLARDDPRAAIGEMATMIGNDRASAEAGSRPGAPVGDPDTNLRRFFTHDFPAVRSSTLDADSIADAAESTVIVPAGGVDSRGQWEYRCAQQLAHRLGRELTEMPGGHNGLVAHPWAAAAELTRLFTESSGS